MATSYTSNKKIGALNAASTPLAATDEIVINQNGDILKTPLNAVEAKVFDAKTASSSPTGTEVVVVRQTDNTLRQVALSDIVPALNITNAKVSASAAIEDTKLATINTAGKVTNNAVQAVATNTANRIVTRDGSGNFEAGTITATLSGNASTATFASSVADAAVTTAKIADSNVTTAKIADSNVTTAKILDANVTTAKILDANVTTAKIADGNVTLEKLIAAVQEALVPIGGIVPFGRTTAPAGWLACNGQPVNRIGTYAALFAAIGTTWGVGNGSTTFNVPDLQDRYLRHAGATFSGAIGTTQADEVKSHAHTASTNSTGAHTHTVSGTAASDGAHTHTASTNSTGAHTHTFNAQSLASAAGGGYALANNNANVGSNLTGLNNAINSAGNHSHTVTVNSGGAHTHSVSGTAASAGNHSHTVTVNNTGGTENRPYSATVLYCIKF